MLTFLCLASYFKGEDFLRSAKAAGCRVFLVTGKKLEDKPWPREAIDEMFFVEEGPNHSWNLDDVVQGLAWVMRSRKVDRIIALDDFDVEKAAHLREVFRLPGMGQTVAHYFRDKLAMRVRAAETGIPAPAFSPLFNDAEIERFAAEVPGPWMVKPRSEASATGIKKVHTQEELWNVIHGLGDKRHQYLVEQFKPGDVYHVDALSLHGDLIFARVSQYLNPPFDVAHGGGIFRSATVEFGSEDDLALRQLTDQVMKAFQMDSSASHTEFIRSREDGRYYLVETSARVGGAHLAEMVEKSSDVNLWGEWARIEAACARGEAYELPPVRYRQAGIVISLTRQEHPDDSSFNDPEVCWRMKREHHIGLILCSEARGRVVELLDSYTRRIYEAFHASAPAPDRPTA